MQFYLVYRGPLSSTQGKRGKRKEERIAIRKQISPQLQRLWEVNGNLIALQWDARVPSPENVGNFIGDVKSPFGARVGPPNTPPQSGFVDLTAPIEKLGHMFRPLIRKSLDLTCSLNILFLRQEDPGALLKHGGDIDNRIKTFIDALEMPADELEGDEAPNDINYPLFENDTLLRGLQIRTDRLLLPETQYPNEVHLVVEATIHVERVGEWNISLL